MWIFNVRFFFVFHWYPAACWQCLHPDREADVRPVSPSVSVWFSLSLPLSAAVQILAFLHSSISLLYSSQSLHTLRHAGRQTQTHVQYHHIATNTHLSWSSCRTRGGEKRVGEFGFKSCSHLQTAGNVELMSVCLSSAPPLSFSLSFCLSVTSWQLCLLLQKVFAVEYHNNRSEWKKLKAYTVLVTYRNLKKQIRTSTETLTLDFKTESTNTTLLPQGFCSIRPGFCQPE